MWRAHFPRKCGLSGTNLGLDQLDRSMNSIHYLPDATAAFAMSTRYPEKGGVRHMRPMWPPNLGKPLDITRDAEMLMWILGTTINFNC